ncbi:hypothetical protein C3Y87_13285 [Carbonactinospora thermoautotrophica]|uniref:Uncharacterized protein n=1 Tax=Carbonactinospora thermoautotrophica TaxID=1469144 RepID=A0A132MTH5_9ACTN|nr:hypothetical protein [Carbonactinospora thermoautotrophica]KWX01167.1 hypothetical protein LI90_2195 [Carbonactinospora thermoautotrophica]KWX05434.1 hypothetical protein TR74_23765 [Carbonactinospora thermoautotrophica]KWX05525.1 hypothetical protein TH66_02305 [Carbonactinospora thermoautotrophica]MCX9192365.1 hypothetical protein [Carbonactinospora thermoautotrophica]
MSLDWAAVVKRYENGARLEPLLGVSTLSVTGVDEEKIYVKHRLWEASLSRRNLERAVELLENGKMTRVAADFIDQYRTFIEDERPSTAATILKDLGYLD